MVDLISQVLLVVIVLINMTLGPTTIVQIVYAICAMLMMVKLLEYFRGFESFAKLVGILVRNARDMIEFLVVLFVLMFFFAIAFMMLYSYPDDAARRLRVSSGSNSGDDGGDDDGPSFDNLTDSLFSIFLMILGEFSTNYENTISPNTTLWFFIAFNIVVVLVCLNAVIALLGDSYASVMESSEAVYCRETAELIVEYYDTMLKGSRVEAERDSAWVHVLDPWSKHWSQKSSDESVENDPCAELSEIKASQAALHGRVDEVAALLRRLESRLPK